MAALHLDGTMSELLQSLQMSMLPHVLQGETFRNRVLPAITHDLDKEAIQHTYIHSEEEDVYQLNHQVLSSTSHVDPTELVQIFAKYFSEKHYADSVLPRSAWYSHRFSDLRLPGLTQLRDFKQTGNKPAALRNFQLLNDANAIAPTPVDDRSRLRLPQPVPQLFNLSSKHTHTKYRLVVCGVNADTLLYLRDFEPNNSTPSYYTLSPWLFEREHEELQLLDQLVPPFGAQDVLVERQRVYAKNEQYYLTVPDGFAEPLRVDTMFLQEGLEMPDRPAFAIFYDAYGNFLFQRFLYQSQTQKIGAFKRPIFTTEVPTELSQDELQSFGPNDLRIVRILREVMPKSWRDRVLSELGLNLE